MQGVTAQTRVRGDKLVHYSLGDEGRGEGHCVIVEILCRT